MKSLQKWPPVWPYVQAGYTQNVPFSQQVMIDLMALRDTFPTPSSLERENPRVTDWLALHAEARDQLVDAFQRNREEGLQPVRHAFIQIAVVALLAAEAMDRNHLNGRTPPIGLPVID